MGGRWKERRWKSGNTALAARSARVGWLPEGTPKKEREYRFIGGHKKDGSNTMLNILYRVEEGERAEANNGLHCIILRYIRMDTITSLYRRERGVLAPNLTNVGQAPHIH
jgi:hypothetical protein